MTARNLTDVILEGGIASVNFFNGRLLSGEDLTQEQFANRAARERLGQALGDGVAFGLGVAQTLAQPPQTGPVVAVDAGLAVNRSGGTLALAGRTELALTRPPETAAVPAGAGAFRELEPLQSGAYVVGTGVYLLVISPGGAPYGRVPASGLGNVDPTCTTNYTVDGVQFRLIELPLSADELNDTLRLRNLVAYKCFGIADDNVLGGFHANPFAPPLAGYGLLDTLRAAGQLTDEDVPLAVVGWTLQDGVLFVDPWSVRRRVTLPSATAPWALALGDRRRSEAEAMFLQFQQHLEQLRVGTPNPESLSAIRYFRYLPPLGFLPPAGTGGPPGFNYPVFFYQRAYRAPVFLEGAGLGDLIRTALDYPPIDLAGDEMVFLYRVRENLDPRAFGAAAPPSYLIFTSGHVPFRGQGLARFDVARIDYSNYVSALAVPQ
jgi:hypothetical protein